MLYEDVIWLLEDRLQRDPGSDQSQEARDAYICDRLHKLSAYDEVVLILDKHRDHKTGAYVPVGFICLRRDDWVIRPHVHWFHWAERRHKVRGIVQYLLRRVRSKDLGANVGLCEISANEENKSFFEKMNRYITIRSGGKVPFGRPDGPAFMFYVKGRLEQEVKDVVAY